MDERKAESGGYQLHLNEIELELVEIKRINVLEWNKRGTNLLLHIFKLNFVFFFLYATSNSHLTRMVFPIVFYFDHFFRPLRTEREERQRDFIKI